MERFEPCNLMSVPLLYYSVKSVYSKDHHSMEIRSYICMHTPMHIQGNLKDGITPRKIFLSCEYFL